MKKGKIRSDGSLLRAVSAEVQVKEEIIVPLDELSVKILSLTTNDDIPRIYTVQVTFFDQIIVAGVLQSVGARDIVKKRTLAQGIMSYDPSDYDRMCLLADQPLCVNIQPYTPESNVLLVQPAIEDTRIFQSPERTENNFEISCCNIDILILFLGQDKLLITKRLEPNIPPSALSVTSWNNLPKISMEISVNRNKDNHLHHKLLSEANAMKITLIGSYNMILPFDNANVYTAATKIPMSVTDEKNSSVVTYNEGRKIPRNFNNTSFYPNWECLRLDHAFTKSDEKFECKIEDVTNSDNFDLHYMDNLPDYAAVWGSFHRSLMYHNYEKQLFKDVQHYKWPFEIHIYNEYGSYGFMAFLDLFKLLYPGETVVRSVIPLQWINADKMKNYCGCDLLTAPKEKTPSAQTAVKKQSKATTDSVPISTSAEIPFFAKLTGDEILNAFIFVEVKLARPLRKATIPPHISMSEINQMLTNMEEQHIKRECTGRGQLNREWQATVKSAANSLRRIPYYGMIDICAVNRQLSETRNRVEMVTSFWQDAAVNVNNNFVLPEFLKNDNLYEELLMMAHACLMRTAYDTLVGVDKLHELDSILIAARHARQLKDLPHAIDLFLQLISQKPRDANIWRELATCLKEMDRDWAKVCINKSITLNLRHPLTLLSKACMVFEEDPDAAEPFFLALLSLYPFWIPMWVAVNAYYIHREMFLMAEEIMECVVKTSADSLEEIHKFSRNWESELGDWWEHTPLLPGSSVYYEAADLLLRIRAISLAEVCIARALCQSGETAAHYHLVALCCRLRKEPTDALCHLKLAIAKFGDINYLRSLEAECYHKLKNFQASQESFEKAGTCTSAYSILLSLSRRDSKRMRSLLVDVIRRQPNAYAWMALADDWMMRSASGDCEPAKSEESSSALIFATACAVQALKWDRRAGRGWAMLSKLVKPTARRLFCKTMAAYYCGYNKSSDIQLSEDAGSQQSFCHLLGSALRECRCDMCQHLTL